jgi:hypothetical protein
MRELNNQELGLVSGGITITNSTAVGGASAIIGVASSNSYVSTYADPSSTSGNASNYSQAYGVGSVAVSGATSGSGAGL